MGEPRISTSRRSMTRFAEIMGVNYVNKGAELMLRAVVDACRSSGLDLVPAVALRHGSFGQRTRAGVRHLLRLGAAKAATIEGPFVAATRLLPHSTRLPLGLVREADVSVVLDASGFAYSDQWGPAIVRANVRHIRRWKRAGRRYVLLPQAFGPFERPDVRDPMTELLAAADLVFARDRESLAHLHGLGGRVDHVRLAPDFTNLLHPDRSTPTPSLRGHVVFIPNLRMVDKGMTGDANQYVERMAAMIGVIAGEGVQCSVVAHETGDVDIARRIGVAVPGGVPVVVVADPLAIKAMLGEARLVVSSRFHGLVSALAEAVPAVGIGWSHKYAELMRDYASEDCIGSSLEYGGDVLHIVRRELQADAQEARRALLRVRAAAIKQESEAMWREVFELVAGLTQEA